MEVNYGIIIFAAFLAVVSPGPATLAIANASMSQGRQQGAILALGITTGSLIWSLSAAFGISALMLTEPWIFTGLRYIGAAYLLTMAWQSAMASRTKTTFTTKPTTPRRTWAQSYWRGVALHLTNPKAILFFVSLYSIAIPQNTPISEIMLLNFIIVFQGLVVFQLYALLFSRAGVRTAYFNSKQWFDRVFAVVFGAIGLGIGFWPS